MGLGEFVATWSKQMLTEGGDKLGLGIAILSNGNIADYLKEATRAS